jgi:hypothetical protein
MDPSTKMVMDDLYLKNGIKPTETDGFYAGVIIKSNDSIKKTAMEEYIWNKWDMPTYHERLKKSYFILKDVFGRIGDK